MYYNVATRNFITSGKSHARTDIAGPSKQQRVVLRRRNTIVGGKCALPSALLVWRRIIINSWRSFKLVPFAFHSNYGHIFNRLASKNSVTLKTGLGVVQGHWKWRRDRPYTTFYWSAIVNIAVSATVFEFFDVEWYHDLEIWVRGHSMSFKIESLGAVSYSPSIVTMAISCISSEIKADIGWKSWFFFIPLAFDDPVRGVPVGYCHPVWYGKTRMGGGATRWWNNFDDMYNHLRTVGPNGVWQTDRQTDRHLATA